MVEEVHAALADAGAARSAGADLVEYRIDSLFHGEGDAEGEAGAVRLVRESPLPCIVTCRSSAEGGSYDGDDSARVSLYEKLGTLDHPPRYIDVELATYTRSANLRQKVNLAVDHPGAARDLSTSLILSTHDFAGRPANLFKQMSAMRAEPAARVHKIAFRARSLRDNLELFELLRERDRPTIALGMGEFGLMSRVLAPKFGGFLTFASLRDSAATAPGQPTIAELLGLYRFRSITAATQLFGVIGWPVGHSRSPMVHNAGFEAAGRDAVYVPMPIAEGWEPFKATVLELLGARWLEFRGASVTLPHKEHLVRLAREDSSRAWTIDRAAALAGAGNTLVVDDAGACRVMNSDADAAGELLRAALGGSLHERTVGILGAGGAARGVAAGVLLRGGGVRLFARNLPRASALADELGRAMGGESARITTHAIDKISSQPCEAIVNCTPVGMLGGGAEGESPLSEDQQKSLRPGTVVFDTVYNPPSTPLLRSAGVAGLPTITGVDMFVSQAAAQFEAWTAVKAPISLFRRVLAETLDSTGP